MCHIENTTSSNIFAHLCQHSGDLMQGRQALCPIHTGSVMSFEKPVLQKYVQNTYVTYQNIASTSQPFSGREVEFLGQQHLPTTSLTRTASGKVAGGLRPPAFTATTLMLRRSPVVWFLMTKRQETVSSSLTAFQSPARRNASEKHFS